MKLVIILVVVAVLLLGGGGAAYFFRDALFGDGGETPAAAKAPIKSDTDALFVDLETINIAVIQNRRVLKHVILQVSLEIANEEVRSPVTKSLPRIKDAFINDMYDYYAIIPANRKGVNVEAIKKRLKRTVDTVMRDGSVKDVLIQGAIERDAVTN